MLAISSRILDIFSKELKKAGRWKVFDLEEVLEVLKRLNESLQGYLTKLVSSIFFKDHS
jgi:hypothetical protein